MDKLWAVARSTFLQVIRSRVTGVFFILTLAIMIVLPIVSQSPARLDMLRTFVAYSLGLGSFALSFLTIFIGCQLLCGEIENHQIYTPLTKPVSRYVYVLGKWLGLVLSQGLLLVIFGLCFYVTSHYLRVQYSSLEPTDPISRQFFSARVKYVPSDFVGRFSNEIFTDTTDRIQLSDQEKKLFKENLDNCQTRSELLNVLTETIKQYEIKQWTQNTGIPDTAAIEVIDQKTSAIVSKINSNTLKLLQSAGPDEPISWKFSGLPMPDNSENMPQLFIKLNAQSAFAHDFLYRPMAVRNPDTGAMKQMIAKLPVGNGEYFELPKDILTGNGNLQVQMINTPPPDNKNSIRSSISVYNDNIYVIYKVGSFSVNLAKALLLIFILQAFLAAVTMFTSSWLTLPVALMWCSLIYLVGLSSNFLIDANADPGSLEGALISFSQIIITTITALLGDFSLLGPSEKMVDALLIPSSDVLMAVVKFLAIRSVILLAASGVILRHRELARVTAK